MTSTELAARARPLASRQERNPMTQAKRLTPANADKQLRDGFRAQIGKLPTSLLSTRRPVRPGGRFMPRSEC
jgi:hypothetical protein